MSEIVEIRKKNMGGMQSLLLNAAIPNAENEVSIEGLATYIGITASTMYKYIVAGEIPYAMVRSIVAHNNLYWTEYRAKHGTMPEGRWVTEAPFVEYLSQASMTKKNHRHGDVAFGTHKGFNG